MCASRHPPNTKYAADNQTRGQFQAKSSVKHVTLSDVSWNIQADGKLQDRVDRGVGQ